MTHLDIIGIAGSLREASYSQAVLRSVFHDLPLPFAGRALDIGRFPHYSEDLEREALPEYVASSRAASPRLPRSSSSRPSTTTGYRGC